MELDDLKNTWKQAPTTSQKIPDIMELIHQKSRSPLASLKHAFKRQMVALAALMAAVTATNSRYLKGVPGYVLFFSYITFCLAVIIALYLNYRRTSQMEKMDKDVKQNLQEYVVQLEQRLRWQYVGSRAVVVLLMVLLEVLPLFYHTRMLDRWHSVHPLIRLAAYGLYFAFVFFFSRRIKQQKFGQHLTYLKEMLNTMK